MLKFITLDDNFERAHKMNVRKMTSTVLLLMAAINIAMTTTQLPEATGAVASTVTVSDAMRTTEALTTTVTNVRTTVTVKPTMVTGASTTTGIATTPSTTVGAPATTSVHATTTRTTAPPLVALHVTIQQVFVKALSNPQSKEFQVLAANIVKMCDLIYRPRYGTLFTQTVVVGFKPVVNTVFCSGMGTVTEAEVELVFNGTSNETFPKGSDIADILKSIFNLYLDPNSITVITSPSTAIDVMTNTTATPVATSTTRGTTTTTSISVGRGNVEQSVIRE
eukprot:XP_014033132.1 PREDICTED: mucin-5AC-like [Salmo salar]